MYTDTSAQDSYLQVKPTRCIALHEGQTCYQTLNIKWATPLVGDYCIFQQVSTAPLMCWRNVNAGTVTFEFESNNSEKFLLLRQSDKQVVADATIEVAWIYKAASRRESRWRVF